MAILPERHTALVPGAIVSIGAECAIGVVMWQRSLLYMVALLDAGAQGCKTGDTAYAEIGASHRSEKQLTLVSTAAGRYTGLEAWAKVWFRPRQWL